MSNINESQKTNVNEKWCKYARAKDIISILGRNPFTEANGCHIRNCNIGETCTKGAHKKSEIHPTDDILKWNKMDKSTFKFSEIYDEIIFVINHQKSKIKDVSTFKARIDKMNELNFIELIQLWHDLSIYYRKMAKQLVFKNDWKSSVPPKVNQSGYVFSDDVPLFKLNEDIEEYVWCFERMTKYCEIQMDFIDKITKKARLTIWDICVFDVNCKNGVHHKDERVCAEDFLNGKCDCKSKEEFDNEKMVIKNAINNIRNELSKTNISKKRREELNIEFSDKQIEFNNLQRMIHYTEQGMVPFNEQYKKHLIKKKLDEERKKLEEEEKEKARVKPSWDHSLGKNEAVVGKVIKIPSLKKK